MSIKNILGRVLPTGTSNTNLAPAAEGTEQLFSTLASTLPVFLQWEWDEQHNGILAILEIDAADAALAVLGDCFGESWDRGNIRKAPQLVNRAPRDFGGLHTNQKIFARGVTEDIILLGLWWPWGHGGTVSIRLLPYGPDATEPDVSATRVSIQKAFTQ